MDWRLVIEEARESIRKGMVPRVEPARPADEFSSQRLPFRHLSTLSVTVTIPKNFLISVSQ